LLSAPLIIFVPFGLLAIVGLLCFVGCSFQGQSLPFWSTYSGDTVLANPAVVAYWPLDEIADTAPAADRVAGRNGNYVDGASVPSFYPWPVFSVPNPPGPDIQSAAGLGTLALEQPGLLPGDAIQPHTPNFDRTHCIVVNGGYVNVPFNAAINPPTSFTIEAWVRVDWNKDAVHAYRSVLESRDIGTGFAIYAKADDNQPGVYHWEAAIGNGGAGGGAFTLATSDDPPIILDDSSLPAGITYYLAVTYDGPNKTLVLYVDGEQRGPKVTPASYVPNTTQPLWIGAGGSYKPLRPQGAGVVAGPLFPFVGAIQDVAVYNAALTSDVILLHYHNGNSIAS
jgi:Concanavalin A-like lectin/glucanases superfamily